MRHFLLGYRCLLSGFALLVKPGIRLYVLVPLLVNILLFAAVIALAVWQTGNLIGWAGESLGGWISGEWPRVAGWIRWMDENLPWIGVAIYWTLWALFVALVLVLLFFTFALVANLLAAPFNGMLAESVTRYLAAAPAAAAADDGLGKAVKSEVGKIKYHLLLLGLTLLLSLPLFLFLQPALPFLWFLFGAWTLALEYLEYPLGNRGKTFLEVRDIAAGKLLLTLGFGTGVALLTMIPVLNFIAMPVAVAAAAKLALENLPEGG